MTRLICLVILLIGCAWQTHYQSDLWSSSFAVWANAAHVAPQAPLPMINLAGTLMNAQAYAPAEPLLVMAYRLSQQRSEAERLKWDDLIWANMGIIRLRQGRVGEAHAYLLGGIDPTSARWLVCHQFQGLCAS